MSELLLLHSTERLLQDFKFTSRCTVTQISPSTFGPKGSGGNRGMAQRWKNNDFQTENGNLGRKKIAINLVAASKVLNSTVTIVSTAA